MKSRVGGCSGAKSVCVWVPVGGSTYIVSDAGVWGSVGFHADVGMPTCPKARVLIPSNIYLLVSRGARATLCTVSPYIVCARDLKLGMSRWNTSFSKKEER